MEDQYKITFEGNLIKVSLNGREDIEVASRLWPEVVEACQKYNCFKVLGVAETTKPLGAADSYQHAELFKKLGIQTV